MGPGALRGLRYFAHELVMFRGGDGTAHVLGVGHLRTRGLAAMAQLLLQTPIDAEHLHVRWQFPVPRAPDWRRLHA